MSVSPSGSSDDLVAAARRLEAEAITVGEDGPRGRELRSQAAELRVRALGARPYPVVVCKKCYRVTGWTDGAGNCDACLRSAQLHAAYADPHGGWVSMEGARRSVKRRSSVSLAVRLSTLAGREGPLARAAARAWLSHVEPGETGPPMPEDGYELEGAKRAEIEARDGSGILIRFSTETHRFAGTEWLGLEKTAIAHADLLVPAEFSAGLPIEQLVEAWGDYQAAVARFNRRAWEQQSAAREAEERARADREDALRQQRHVSELLKEET